MAVTREMVKVAFENHVQDNLETTYTVHWPGTSFDATAQDEWLKVDHLGFSPLMLAGGGDEDDWQFQIICVARMGEQTDATSTNRVWELVDDVIDNFKFTDVDVLDRDQSGNPKIGTLQFTAPNVTTLDLGNTGAPGDQIALTLPARYTEVGP